MRGHTLARVLDRVELTTGIEVKRVFVDKGYRGHRLTGNRQFHVYHDGLKRCPPEVKRQVKRRAAVEPVIGHLKSDGHLDRNFLAGRAGDRANAVLAAVGYNYRQVLNWIRLLCVWIVLNIAAKQRPLGSLQTA